MLLLGSLCILNPSSAQENGHNLIRRFPLEQGDTVVFTGGANLVAVNETAYLETLLTLSFAQQRVSFRNMAWEGDTVYEQRREMNFGSWQQQFARVGVTVLFVQFGQMESFQGAGTLPGFLQAFEKLLDQFTNQTQRIVLLSPTPFEKPRPPLPDLSTRNSDLGVFVEAIRKLAAKRKMLFLDLFTPFADEARDGLHVTDNGLQLTAKGHWVVAREICRQLGLQARTSTIQANPGSGVLRPDSAERLREAIQAKNRLWFDYWRPMNWAFLNGDRTEQPSSRDHRDRNVRWFPNEMKQFLPLIDAKEKEIELLAQRPAK